jgi:hypothetical protein
MSKSRSKFKTVLKKKERERTLVTFPTKKKKGNPRKKQPTHSPLQCQNPVRNSKFKSILKKRKKGNVSDVPNQKKERKSTKKSTHLNVKIQVKVMFPTKKKKGTPTKKSTHLNVKIQVEVQDRS